MKTKLYSLIIVLVLFQSANSQVQTNLRVFPSSNLQVETPLCISGQNEQVMAGAAVTDFTPGGSSSGFYITTNGGLNWSGTDAIRTINGTVLSTFGNPSIVIDKNNNYIMSFLKFSGTCNYQVGVSVSTNSGLNWSSITYVPGVTTADKDLMATDNNPLSPYYGNCYIVYAEFVCPGLPNPIGTYFSKSTNGGLNWSTAVPISTLSTGSGFYPSIVIGANGQIYVSWATVGGVGFAKSLDGGSTWTRYDQIFYGTPGFTFIKDSLLLNSIPSIAVDKNNGNLYVVCRPSPNFTDAIDLFDIELYKSTNQGVNWTYKRVNQDNTGYLKYQFFPAISIDKYSGINVTYYDTRNSITNDTFEVYLSRSIDGGNTFNDYLVSDHKFKLKTIASTVHPPLFGYPILIGSYTGLVSNSEKIQALWFDNSYNNNYQAWTASILIGPYIKHTPLMNTTQLGGNYTVNCSITPVRGTINSSLTKIFWSRNNSAFQSVNMTNTGGNNWSASIPGNGTQAIYKYYIQTYDSYGTIGVHPDRAPTNVHTFVASSNLTPPSIAHTQLTDQPKDNFPCEVKATASDASGVNSVWVVWNKNSENNKQFNLNLISSNQYSGFFNEVNSYVNYGDIIHYKIFARDNSLASNVDSTGLFTFTINYFYLCEAFTSTNFPPVNWSLENTGKNYWSRINIVGDPHGGIGKFDFYRARGGFQQSLFSATFTSSLPGDVLKFDCAHAEKSSSVNADTLFVESSTNNGASYTTLATLYGSELNTAPAQTSEFFPLSNQWVTKEYSVPAGTNKIRYRPKAGGGNNLFLDNICVGEFTVPQPVSVKVIPQGFYNVAANKLNSKDTVRAYFRNTAYPYIIADSAIGKLDSITFAVSLIFSHLHSGNYYLEVKHRNSIETWSKSPMHYERGSTLSYNFTGSDTSAYGNNLILVGTKYCIFSGDVNQDGIVDLIDLGLVDDDVINFVTGYVQTDVTGDGFVDLVDLMIVDNNSLNFVSKQVPGMAMRPPVSRKKKSVLSE